MVPPNTPPARPARCYSRDVSTLATAPARATPEPAGAAPRSGARRVGLITDLVLGVALATGFCVIVFAATGGTDLGPTHVGRDRADRGRRRLRDRGRAARGPRACLGSRCGRSVRGARRAHVPVDRVVGPAGRLVGGGEPHAVLSGRVRRRGGARPAGPGALARARIRSRGRGRRDLRLCAARQGVPGDDQRTGPSGTPAGPVLILERDRADGRSRASRLRVGRRPRGREPLGQGAHRARNRAARHGADAVVLARRADRRRGRSRRVVRARSDASAGDAAARAGDDRRCGGERVGDQAQRDHRRQHRARRPHERRARVRRGPRRGDRDHGDRGRDRCVRTRADQGGGVRAPANRHRADRLRGAGTGRGGRRHGRVLARTDRRDLARLDHAHQHEQRTAQQQRGASRRARQQPAAVLERGAQGRRARAARRRRRRRLRHRTHPLQLEHARGRPRSQLPDRDVRRLRADRDRGQPRAVRGVVARGSADVGVPGVVAWSRARCRARCRRGKRNVRKRRTAKRHVPERHPHPRGGKRRPTPPRQTAPHAPPRRQTAPATRPQPPPPMPPSAPA